MIQDKKSFLYLSSNESFENVAKGMKQLWHRLDNLMEEQRFHNKELIRINKEIESIKKEMSDFYDKNEDKIVKPNIREDYNFMPPKSDEELCAAIDKIPIRFDKVRFLSNMLGKDFNDIYEDIIEYLSDDEFDEICKFIIMHKEEYES